MKRTLIGLAVAGALVLGIAGCARPAATAPSAPSPATSVPGTGAPKTWAALDLGPNETTRLNTIGPLLKLWADNERKAGRTPEDLSGIKPKLVGYRVQLWAPEAGPTFSLLAIQVTDGRVDQLGDFQIPLTSKNVSPVKGQPTHPSEGVTPQSSGERDAITLSLAWAKAEFPSQHWSAGIEGYQFYYPLKKGYLLFIADAKTKGYLAFAGGGAK